jgi:transcriptional regulator with XRE-family HTH domain
MTRQPSAGAEVNVPAWNIDAFSERLRQALNGKTPYSLERETGIAQSLIRKYLSGQSVPGTDKLVALAIAAGVSVTWLATGEGEATAVALSHQELGREVDLSSLEEVTRKVLQLLDERRPDLSSKARARIVRLVYEFYLRQGEPMDEASLNNVIELAAFR